MAQFQYLSTAATTVVDNDSGKLFSVVVGTAGDAASTVTLYDNTAASGTIIGVIDASSKGGYRFDGDYHTGLTAAVAGTTAPKVTISYGNYVTD